MRALLIACCLFAFVQSAVAQTRRKVEKPKPTTSRLKKKGVAEEIPSFPRTRAPEVGDKGTLYSFGYRIVQILDEENALAELRWAQGFDISGIPVAEEKILVWLTVPTTGKVDKRWYETGVDEQFEVVGTKSYESGTGKRTVLHVKRVEAEDKAKKGK